MTWEIVAGIITLAGFIFSIASWISKLSKTLAVLETTIQALNNVLCEFKENSRNTHRELFMKLHDHDRMMENHEVRIKDLEKERNTIT